MVKNRMTDKTFRRLATIYWALVETTDELSIQEIYISHISPLGRVEGSFIGKDLSILLAKNISQRIKDLLENPPLRHFLNVSVPGSRQKNDLRAAVERQGGAIRILVFPGDGKQVATDLHEELEAERERIGRLLHDEVGQLLYAARLNLQHFLSQHQAHLGDITPTK